METTVSPTGHQRGVERYGTNFGGAPPIAHWRANLIALSQIHNFYFIAYGADIYVYRPQFPSQKIGNHADLIIRSQPSAPRLSGYIDRRNPHCINNLVIEFLGTEEVIAVVRDDGDVDAFLVRHIAQAIERRAEQSNTLGSQATEIRPFFQNNVGISAWGLAIHTEARIIAVSSNAHEVRIFKFGLASSSDQDESPLSSPPEASESSDRTEENDREHERHSDITHHIINGESNIPYIAFCNTGDDPEGRWLLTTDISGLCRLMDLRKLRAVQLFQFGRVDRRLEWGGFDRIHAGWLLMFLDRRSFQETEDFHAAVGLREKDISSCTTRDKLIWDLSATVERLSGHRQPFTYHKRAKGDRSMSAEQLPKFEIADSSTSEVDMNDESMDDDSDGGAPLQTDVEMLEGDSLAFATSTATTSTNLGEVSSIVSDNSNDSSINIVDDAEDSDDELTNDPISFNSWTNQDDTAATSSPELFDNATGVELCCPILHASCRNIYLLQPSDPRLERGQDQTPLIGLTNPLRQRIQQDFEYLSQQQRLNMAVYIKPLGIVVVASQKGRAMVLSLSKLPPTAAYPPEMLMKSNHGSEHVTPPYLDKMTYVMRVECILPFADQEKLNHRPFMPLHGIAASPLQGCEIDEAKGTAMRWRLMMMYQDHSILSYEISRSMEEGGVKATPSGVGTTLESVMI